MVQVGKNIQVETTKDGKIIITIDPEKRFGPSASGKTTIVATTGGNIPIPGMEDIKIGINAYVKN